MSSLEIVTGLRWLKSTLSGDSALTGYAPGGVWTGMAPLGTSAPYVVMSFQGGSDVVTMNGYRMIVDAVFAVKAVGPASGIDNIANAAARIDQLLGNPPTSGSTADGLVLASYAQTPIYLDEMVDGSVWTNIGQLYRLQIQQMN